MTAEEFIRQRPCLEEIEGYLEGLRQQIEHPEKFGTPPQYPEITTEVMAVIEKYRKRLLGGKEVPADGRGRSWKYQLKRKPVRK